MTLPTDAQVRPLLRAAGAEALSRFRREALLTRKSDDSAVTAADLASERILCEGLAAAFPGDVLLSEEAASDETQPGARRWWIDPIDGTGSFLEGLAHWGPTVALQEGDSLVYGAFYLPRTDDYFFAEGERAYWNDQPLPPLADAPPNRRSILYIPSRLHAHADLDWPGKGRNLGSLAAHLCLAAAGSAAAALIPGGWKPWDVGAGLALLARVGGAAAVFGGAPLDLRRHAGQPFAAGAPAAVRWLTEPGRIQLRTPTLRG